MNSSHCTGHDAPIAAETTELQALYANFQAEHLAPLWTQLGNLMPQTPEPKTQPHLWRWERLYALAKRAGELVPVGRGGERRAIGLANPGLGGAAYATSTLWAAIQYLGPHEAAPEHRHTQNAFRFVLEGEGVWTVVNGDPIAMRRGDFLPQPGWNFHAHRNETDQPMAWLDGLDIPFVHYVNSDFFEFGANQPEDRSTPDVSRSERLWAYPGLRPLSRLMPHPSTPLLCYRWEHTDRALVQQLALEAEGHAATVHPGHAAVRYVNPTTGGDVMPTLRVEFHRLLSGRATPLQCAVGSAVVQVFNGSGALTLAGTSYTLNKGDIFVVPSWVEWSVHADETLDLFQFSDAPIMEKLEFARLAVRPPA
ncbi:MAG: cupin domain-containing protein [Castellaniella sp.]|uniref:cupin domain-containing protein n=1 Tax=Castellaniella sp. TaxID=1955812 RepID=UPI0012235326|nr:cupin domain-containing protein [Castellaniella sp.]TAN27113.1 MAG: cupin domain-containing protein [Castellaniella sp.]